MWHDNVVRLKVVANALQPLSDQIVFVGGATVALYAKDEVAAFDVRVTDDVDVIVEIATYGGYSILDEILRGLGFQNDVESGVICRYRIQGIVVDVMPTEDGAIGFSNKWYPDGFKTAQNYRLDENTGVKIFTLPFFIASKWEAFKGRGHGDYRTSKDFEDLVFVFENGLDVRKELEGAPEPIRNYLRNELAPVVYSADFEEGLLCHINSGYSGGSPDELKQMLIDTLKID